MFNVNDVLQAKYPSSGFQKRTYWADGELTEPLSEDDLNDKSIKHFELFRKSESEPEAKQTLSSMSEVFAQGSGAHTGLAFGQNLSNLNPLQLKKLARQKGVEIPEGCNSKAELIELLDGH